MRASLFAVAAVGITVSAFGCSSPSHGDLGRSSERSAQGASAIQGGTVTTDYSYVVGVTNQGGRCSGALIAPNLVMTARHCVDETIANPADPSQDNIVCGVSQFGGQAAASSLKVTTSPTLRNARFYTGAQIFRTPGNAFCGNDMALIVLTANVPAAEAAPITPNVQYKLDDARFSTTFTAIGYGITSPTANDSGTRRIRQSISMACSAGHRDARFDCNKVAPSLGIPKQEFVGGDGTCEGDSGSSALEQISFTAGKPISLGVLSRGSEDTQSNTCVGSLYTRTDEMRDLIIAAVTAASTRGGYAMPDWTKPAPPTPATADAGPPKPTADAGTPATPPVTPPPQTDACTADDPCASGFVCVDGACAEGTSGPPKVGGEPTPSTTPGATTTTTSGCAIAASAPVGKDPGKPIPWGSRAAALVVGAALALRRRRVRDARHDGCS